MSTGSNEVKTTPPCPTSFPTALDLISSDDPSKWTKMVDLTCRLPVDVQAFNTANMNSKITLLGKVSSGRSSRS